MKELTEDAEIKRLKKVYADLPPARMAVAQGLIVQAARLRVRLNQLWTDIQENGETEMFSQSPNTEPYERERPSARLFTATDANYRQIIKQLNELIPMQADTKKKKSALEEFRDLLDDE